MEIKTFEGYVNKRWTEYEVLHEYADDLEDMFMYKTPEECEGSASRKCTMTVTVEFEEPTND
jgi:hypothetical protein